MNLLGDHRVTRPRAPSADPFLQAHEHGVAGALADGLAQAALTGSLCVPSPRAMKALSNGSPSMVPLTFTSPFVPKNSAEPSMTT